MLDFGRELCGNLQLATKREWLVTNGIGGYASGTVAGLLTRRYHGLLVAALQMPLRRTLLLAKLDETAAYQEQYYSLEANRWAGGYIDPQGFAHLERFHLEGAIPVWTYACADARLEKRIWMQPGANTTYVRYGLSRASAPLTLAIKALVNYRNHHGNTHRAWWRPQVKTIAHGVRVTAYEGAQPYRVLCHRADVIAQREWYHDFYLSMETYRGLDPYDDHVHAATFHATLQPGQSLTIVASSHENPTLDGHAAFSERQAYEEGVVASAGAVAAQSPRPDGESHLPWWTRQLALAADQFIVRRPMPDDTQGRTIIAGYPWFGDWGRDTMISLPGLTLTTGRPEIAARILRTFARFVDQGMLPNRFPEAGEAPEYNTVDATLWYFQAIRAYHEATGDTGLLLELFPLLQDIIAWHQEGTRFNIRVDPVDGLLYAGAKGVQLTWMDAKVGDWVVTPRIGKPVEVNALWYSALRSMSAFALQLRKPSARYAALAELAHAGFARFWYKAGGYCYDVLDGPDGDDPALRPNQLFAVSLPDSPLTASQQRSVVDSCAQHLLTSHGLRSLSASAPEYVGEYGGDQRQRDAAYHQGTVWGWLIGPYVQAHLRVYANPDLARSFLQPLVRHLAEGAVGSLSEVFDGDPPHAPRGCIAQAWTVAEVLRAWHLADQTKGQPDA